MSLLPPNLLPQADLTWQQPKGRAKLPGRFILNSACFPRFRRANAIRPYSLTVWESGLWESDLVLALKQSPIANKKQGHSPRPQRHLQGNQNIQQRDDAAAQQGAKLP